MFLSLASASWCWGLGDCTLLEFHPHSTSKFSLRAIKSGANLGLSGGVPLSRVPAPGAAEAEAEDKEKAQLRVRGLRLKV